MNPKKGLNLNTAGGALGGSSSKGRKALGKGLGALIPNVSSKRDYFECEIERIKPDSEQPRRHMDPEGIEELSESIKASGLIQPLIVRQDGADYRLIAGERRWRAANKAGLKTVPVVIKDVDRDEAFELALVENIQREDLNPLEEAQAYQRLMDLRSYTQDALAKRLGRSRPSVANTLRLLKLPLPVRDAVSAGELSEGAARAVLSLPEAEQQIELSERAMAEGLSVRAIEAISRSVKDGLDPEAAIAAVLDPPAEPTPPANAEVAEAEAPAAPEPEAIEAQQEPLALPIEEDGALGEDEGDDPSLSSEPRQPRPQTPGDLKVKIAQLEQHLDGRRVTLQDRGGRGALLVHFSDYDELRELLAELQRALEA
ncbi:MAG: chromosome partitioning protein ParB [Myxococcales bacterium]|nr:chromosome partitioning protein ParB [Myxococcales bacterium]